MVAWLKVFDYVVGASAVSVGFAAYLAYGLHLPPVPLILVVSVLTEEITIPEKNLPRAVLSSFAVCTLLYIGVSAVIVGLMSWRALGTSVAPLEEALRAATGNVLILEFVAVSALFAATSAIISSIMGGSRALFSVARQGVIPSPLAAVSRRGIPVVAVLATGVVNGIIVVLTRGALDWLASVFNFGTVVTFLFINPSLIRLRSTMPEARRGFRVPIYPVTPVVGVLSCLLLSFFLDRNAILMGAAWVAVGLAAYAIHRRRRRPSRTTDRT